MRAGVVDRLRSGVVVPAHPLALDDRGGIDLRAQRALTRYYLAAGAHGLALGVHTTQFELHRDRGMLQEVWSLAAGTAAEAPAHDPGSLLVAGVCGDVGDAVSEAELAVAAGYDVALLCPWGMSEVTEPALLDRARSVGEIMPTIGFYLQESVGGRRLSRAYWRRLFDLESVIGVKIAPFDRYRTNDVVGTLLEHDRWDQVTLLTGNDDTIVSDLLTSHRRELGGRVREVRATGGLLGQWAVGTRAAVEVHAATQKAVMAGQVPTELLTRAADLVSVNAAVFDVDHDFRGAVAGVNEVLRQQGLLATARCLGGQDVLSAGQADAIARVRERHPWLLDEDFVAANREVWLA